MMCLYKIQKRRRNPEKDPGVVTEMTGVMSPQAKDSCSHQKMEKIKKESPLNLQGNLLLEWKKLLVKRMESLACVET